MNSELGLHTEAIEDFLRANLSIRIWAEPTQVGNCKLKVQLFLGNDLLSEDTDIITIPNPDSDYRSARNSPSS